MRLEQELFSPLKSESFFSGVCLSLGQKGEIKPAPPYREKLQDGRGTRNAARVPKVVTRLGSFSSFVTSGSDTSGLEGELFPSPSLS